MESCPVCGGKIIGDGVTIVRHCENMDLDFENMPEPDAETRTCNTTGLYCGWCEFAKKDFSFCDKYQTDIKHVEVPHVFQNKKIKLPTAVRCGTCRLDNPY